MTAPIETTESQAGSQPESVLKGVKASQIEGRSLGRIAWNRFKRDKVAVAGGIVVILLVLLAVLSKPIQAMFGLDPNEFHQDLIDPALLSPKGAWGGMSWDHPLGVDPQYGRDILSRIIEGSWVSLLVAGGATLVSVIIGVIMGVTAGFYGGWPTASSAARWTSSSPSRCSSSRSPSRPRCRTERSDCRGCRSGSRC